MDNRLSQLLAVMTLQERKEVEIFSAFLISRRKLQKMQVVLDDISSTELIELASKSGSCDWLGERDEDIYSVKDGEAVAWSNKE